MAISIENYIDITSGVIGVPAVPGRKLIQRMFTTNTLIPVNSFINFTNISSMGDYLGTTSVEYQRGRDYFSYISPLLTQPYEISFAGYSLVAIPALINGGVQEQFLGDLQAYTAAVLDLTIGATNAVTGPIDLSIATDVDNAMLIIQTAIQAANVAPEFASATMVYDAVAKRVIFTAGANGVNPIVVTSPTAGFIDQLAWNIGQATFSDGSDGDTLTEILTTSDAESDNFGTIVFVEPLVLAQQVEIATWNNGENVKYMYLVPKDSTDTNLAADITALEPYAGSGVTFKTLAITDFAESIPAALLASTRYDRTNSVIDYSFKNNFPYDPSVTDDVQFNNLKALLVNFIGEVQVNGQELSFYQFGTLLGPTTSPSKMNVYANEMWLRSDIIKNLMNLFLSFSRIPANPTGQAQITASIQVSINQALLNGTISSDKPLTQLQLAAIAAIANNENAVAAVQGIGYWLEVNIVFQDPDFVAEYLLIYSKDDTISKIIGTHALV